MEGRWWQGVKHSTGENQICWSNVLFVQVYESLWILFPVIKLSRREKFPLFFCRLVMLLRPSEYKRSPTHTFIGNFVISCQDFQSYCLISVLLGTTSREKKEADLSQLVLASFLSFQAAQDDSRHVRWDCGAVSAYSGCLCSPALVQFLSLSSRERATKCFLSHTLRDFNVHLP